ncbi:MAG: pentapeptide repeat-containing protein [Clostridia bacterium]|nr:pentapeptide repeat-containing protein [Clostridia bacterium]
MVYSVLSVVITISNGSLCSKSGTLDSASLSGALLSGALLSVASLSGASLSGSEISGSELSTLDASTIELSMGVLETSFSPLSQANNETTNKNNVKVKTILFIKHLCK